MVEHGKSDAEKQKRGMKPGVKALLIVCIVLFVLVGLPLIYLSAFGGACDNTDALLQQAPMPFAERYAFSAEDKTVSIAVDKGDLYWAAAQEGLFDQDGEIARSLAAVGLTLRGTGISIDEGGITLTVKLLYQKLFPAPIRLRLTLENKGAEITAHVTEARLGKWIPLPVERLIPDLLTYTLDGGELHSRLEKLRSVTMEEGRIVFTCGVGEEIVREMLENYGQIEEYARYLGAFEAIQVARAYHDGNDAQVTAFLTLCENDPAHFVDFKRSELAVAEDHKAGQYFTESDAQYLPRFFPELSADGIAELSTEYDDTYALHRSQLMAMAETLQTLYEAGSISTDGMHFLLLGDQAEPLTLPLLTEDASAFDWLDANAARVIYGHGGSYAMTQNVPPLSKTPKETSDAFAGMTLKDKYVPLLLVKMADGSPRLAFFISGGKFTLVDVTDAQYAEWMAMERIPVAELGLAE